jgi:RNA polymerase sigma-54 factor
MLKLQQSNGLQQQQRQTQELQLSLRAQQRLELLGLQVGKLATELRQRAEQNPFIEFEPPLHEVSIGNFSEAAVADMNQDGNQDYFLSGYEGYGDQRDPMAQAERTARHDYVIASYATPETLYQHLETQILRQYAPGALREQLLLICDTLDANGYLKRSPHELLADWWELHHGHPPERAEERDIIHAITEVQKLDPPGVGARSLAECLELQVRADPTYSVERTLRLKLCQRLTALVSDGPTQLAKVLNCTPAQLANALAYIRTLNPFPGRAFANEPPPEPPEIVAIRNNNGTWRARCNEEDLPLFRMDEAAVDTAKTHAVTKDERAAIAEYEAQARLWTEAYQERNETLRRVAQLVFDRQTAFLESGGDAATLKPLLQRDIAEAIGYDESTISRAVKEKIVRIAGTQKLLPLKAFFTHALPSSANTTAEAVSEQQAKSALKALIDAEDRAHPLSDQTLMEALAQQNIPLARRTVAKYREQLGIPSTRERRCKL